jgi:hypothetical protein
VILRTEGADEFRLQSCFAASQDMDLDS